MMRVTVEIWGGGNNLRPRTMAVVNISNVSDLAPWSDYDVDASINPTRPDEHFVHFTIKQHRRGAGWGILVRRVMSELEDYVRELPEMDKK